MYIQIFIYNLKITKKWFLSYLNISENVFSLKIIPRHRRIPIEAK